MPNELVPITPEPPPVPQICGTEDLVAAFLAGRSPRTVKAYAGDLAHFARWWLPSYLGTSGAIDLLLSEPAGFANLVALNYRNAMTGAGLASATVARRLAALRSVVKLARTLGRVAWSLEIDSPRREARRDVRGPERDDRKKLWKYLDGLGDGPLARRDRAAFALMFDLALRRGEVLGLGLADVDLAGRTVAVVGKGRTERERLTLTDRTARDLASWVEARGREPGPLFHRLDRASRPGAPPLPLTGDYVARMVATHGRRAGLSRVIRPHGFRHAAITAALDSGADVRKVRRFSRHAKIETVIRYDDDREDVGAKISRAVSRERK